MRASIKQNNYQKILLTISNDCSILCPTKIHKTGFGSDTVSQNIEGDIEMTYCIAPVSISNFDRQRDDIAQIIATMTDEQLDYALSLLHQWPFEGEL